MTSTFFDHLGEEHQLIRQGLKVLNKLSQAHESDLLKKAFHYVEFLIRDIHHEKEEVLLFPELNLQPRLREGGPMCGFFFPIFMDGTHINEIQTEASKISPPLPAAHESESIKQMIENKSPLSIPLKEHKISYTGMQLIKRIIEEGD